MLWASCILDSAWSRAWAAVATSCVWGCRAVSSEPPSDAARWAPWEMVINGVAGIVIVFVIFGVVVTGLPFDTWTAVAGSTIWCKFFASFALGRHAHGFGPRKKA